MRLQRLVLAATALALVFAAACGGGGGGDSETPAGATTGGEATEGGGSTATGGTTGAALNADPVDTCELLTPQKAKRIAGQDVTKGESTAPSGSLLGECNYSTADFSVFITLAARPGSEYQGTVDATDGAKEVQVKGATSAAYAAEIGLLLIQPEGRDFMLTMQYLKNATPASEADVVAAAEIILE